MHCAITCKKQPYAECMVEVRNLSSRRCFMTGGYCSKLNLIQEKRKQLHQDNTINAFVVMNFSAISDLQYKRKIRLFIESLKKYLYLSGEMVKCFDTALGGTVLSNKKTWRKVKKINPIRSDATYASNFVMCSRVCQQIMIADLIIVDVSVENANVFYELGMAIALGKLILPICSHESYFSRNYPTEKDKAIFSKIYKNTSHDDFYSAIEANKKKISENQRSAASDKFKRTMAEKYDNGFVLERHLGYFPWRKQLFEHYGIRFRNTKLSKQFDDSKSVPEYIDWTLQEQITRYIGFQYVREPLLELSDQYLTTFPYADRIPDRNGSQSDKQVGEMLYNRLQQSYNYAGYQDNTVVIYITDGFLNEEQSGRCMVNYYNNFTKKLQESGCFCGDRVGVLVQESKIPERRKDSRMKESILYDTGEIFLIAVNEATYWAQHQKIGWEIKAGRSNSKDVHLDRNPESNHSDESKDVHSDRNPESNSSDESSEKYFLKDYLCNKGMIILPEKPVYVKRLMDKLQPEISRDLYQAESNNASENDHFYCLFHIMLENLKYTNQVVVDITDNSLTSLFWLGAANGANIPSIFVKWDRGDDERKELVEELLRRGEKNVDYITNPGRNIFDVAGLWTALLRTNDIDGFYRQIALAQMDIEQQSKLIFQFPDGSSAERKQLTMMQLTKSEYKNLLKIRNHAEAEQWEAFYREQFWKAMLCNNKIYFFLEGHSGEVQKSDSKECILRNHVVERDLESISMLSQYLSKHSLTGEFEIKILGTDVPSESAENLCFISVGSDVKPFTEDSNGNKNSKNGSLVDHILKTVSNKSSVYNIRKPSINSTSKESICHDRRGFEWEYGDKNFFVFTTLPSPSCFTSEKPSSPKYATCIHKGESAKNLIYIIEGTKQSNLSTEVNTTFNIPSNSCTSNLEGKNVHIQLAQIVFWREKNGNNAYVNQVALNGVSGPATKALTFLLVGNEGSGERYVLSQLQEKIRANFIKNFKGKLRITGRNRQSDSSQSAEKVHTCLKSLKWQAVEYLNHVLYQYFLPFLSVADEMCLANGMRYYLRSYAAANTEGAGVSWNTIHNQIDCIEQNFRELIESLCGVQALYQVDVCVNGSDTDNRSIQDIQSIDANILQHLDSNGKETENDHAISESGFKVISCIYKEG